MVVVACRGWWWLPNDLGDSIRRNRVPRRLRRAVDKTDDLSRVAGAERSRVVLLREIIDMEIYRRGRRRLIDPEHHKVCVKDEAVLAVVSVFLAERPFVLGLCELSSLWSLDSILGPR